MSQEGLGYGPKHRSMRFGKRSRWRPILVLAILITSLIAPTAGRAAIEHKVFVVAQYPQFYPSTVVIQRGDALRFESPPVVPPCPPLHICLFPPQGNHQLISGALDAQGNPLFKSEMIFYGQSSEVVGVSSLRPGSYFFYCPIHRAIGMTGTLSVR